MPGACEVKTEDMKENDSMQANKSGNIFYYFQY